MQDSISRFLNGPNYQMPNGVGIVIADDFDKVFLTIGLSLVNLNSSRFLQNKARNILRSPNLSSDEFRLAFILDVLMAQ